jgi:hypothetical protein
MTSPHRSVLCAAGLGVGALLLGACGQAAPAARPEAAAAGTPTPAALATDARACAGAQAVLGHIAAGTSRWAPQRAPFDRSVARQIRTLAGELDQQAQIADTARMRTAVHDVAGAFTAVSAAMTTRHRAAVTSAIAESRVAYRELKGVCSFD